ncbi:fumarylacetoacetate hydrolase family protein [Sphingomonas sp. MMS24-JH45]
MWIDGDIDVAHCGLIQPRAEAEIAFILNRDLRGPGVTAADVVAATAAIAPCFEIVDSRIEDWKIGIVDTVADNASCGVFVLERPALPLRTTISPRFASRCRRTACRSARGSAPRCRARPPRRSREPANTLGAYGVTLDAGDVILSGSLVPLEPAVVGDVFEMELHGIGRCVARFV